MHMISLIVTLYNDDNSISSFYQHLIQNVKDLPMNYECIFVDNGSHDHTMEHLRTICQKDFHFHYISTHHNISTLGAYYIGSRYAQGDILLFMDLQHPTHLLEEFYEAIVIKNLPYAGGVLKEGNHSKRQRYFKAFCRTSLQIYFDQEDFDGFRSFIKRQHTDMFWIPYTDLEKEENPFLVRLIDQLNFSFGRSFIYLIFCLIVCTLGIIPCILILHFHLEISYCIYMSLLLTICVVALIKICHSRFCCLHILKKIDQIKESTFQ